MVTGMRAARPTTALLRYALVAGLAFASSATSAEAPSPTLHVDGGEGDGVRRIAGGISWPGWTDIPCERGCRAGVWWTVRVARWWQPHYRGDHRDLWDLSAMPALRIGSHAAGPRVFVELGAGLHYLSDQAIGRTRGFGTSFQFGETIAAGVEFGARHEQALAARIEHISNGGLEAPNNGITFLLLEYRHDLR
jgi:lipid A 3-O-deacylase